MDCGHYMTQRLFFLTKNISLYFNEQDTTNTNYGS